MSTIAGIVETNLDYHRVSGQLQTMLGGETAFSGTPDVLLGGGTPAKLSHIITVFGGVLHNREELLRKLQLPDELTDDAKLVSMLYLEFGAAFPSRLSGSYHLALYDTEAKRLFLVRDQLGAMPIYYFADRGRLVFAGTAKHLFRHPELPKELDCGAISDFLSLQYVPEPDTVFRHVRQLPHGHLLEYRLDDGMISIRNYRTLTFSLKEDEFYFTEAGRDLREIIVDSVNSHLSARQSPGIMLSGGVDSSIIAGVVGLLIKPERPVDVFTAAVSAARYDESKDAAAIVGAINRRAGREVLRHHVIPVTAPQFSFVEELSGVHDEPYADSSLIPMTMVARYASGQVDSLLTGDGGDELFCGYERYQAMGLSHQLDWLPVMLRKLFFGTIGCCLPYLGERNRITSLRRLCRLLAQKSGADAYFSILDHCPHSVKAGLFGPALAGARRHDSREFFRRLEWELSAVDPVERYAELDIHTYLVGDSLRKSRLTNRLSGVEMRSPLLDRRVREFAVKIPQRFKLYRGDKKHILKKAFKDFEPDVLCRRRKSGFGVPVADWLRDSWREEAQRCLFEGRLLADGFCNREYLEKIWKQHLSGMRDYSYLLWSLIQLSLFLERHK